MTLRRRLEAVVAGESPALWLAALLTPLSLLYAWGVRVRTAMYRSGWLSVTRLPARVVSVGNLTVGGSGKTPVVMALASLLLERNVPTAILSRGYGGKRPGSGVVVVSDGKQVLASPSVAGDEPVLLALRLPGVPVLACPDRVLAGRVALERFQSRVLLLDDGFQHLPLHRDADILLLDGQNPFGNGRLLPRGPLREPVSAVARAHAIVFTGDRPEPSLEQAVRRWNPRAWILHAASWCSGLVPLKDSGLGTGAALVPVDAIRRKRILAFAGIARTCRFWKSLEDAGACVVDRVRFPDHHAYAPRDLERLHALAERLGVDCVVTTEKDAVKLPSGAFGSVPLYALRLEVRLEGSPQRWEAFLTGKAHGA